MDFYMYFLIGYEKVLENLYSLAKPYVAEISSLSDIKFGLRKFLKTHQPDIHHAPENDSFLIEKNNIEKLILSFSGKDILTDLELEDISIPDELILKQALSKISDAINYLKKLSPELHAVFNLTIHTLFYARSHSQGGGSVSSAIGVIWCSNKKNWSLQDTTEFLIHELTHNLFFLDELRFSHYRSHTDIGKISNYCLSSILRIPRPVDKVLHSLLVANEIVSFRSVFGEPIDPKTHPPTKDILKNMENTINSLKSIYQKNILTERSMGIISQIEKKLQNIKEIDTAYA